MAHYLVYVPAEHFEAAEKSGCHPLEHVGLADHVPNAMGVRITDGPDHKGGQLYGWMVPTAQHRLNYSAEQQDWIPAVPDPATEAAAQRYWLGFWRDSPVSPRDIIRPQTTPGVALPIDQHSWRISNADLLPAVAVLTIDGTWGTQPRPDYQAYWSEVESMRQTLGAGFRQMEMADLFEYCFKVLRVNYRLTREVAAHMQVLSTESAPRILRTSLGLSPDPELAGE